MKHTKEQVINKTKKILKDFDIDYYFENTFKTISSDEDEYIRGQYDLINSWWVYVEVPNEQFDHLTGILGIVINDENLEPAIFMDGSGGRIPDRKISKKDGKYQLGE